MTPKEKDEIAYSTLLAHVSYGQREGGYSVQELLTDLMHFTNRGGYDFDEELSDARLEYNRDLESLV